MSKVKKKIIYALLLVVTFLSVTTVNAAGKKIEVSDFSVKDKSGTITVEDPVITDNLVTSNITFNEVGDFVTFKLVLKNNENEKYKIESITDNNTNKNLTIDYTFSKDLINTGETSTVEMKLTYKNKLINQDKISLNDLTIKINLVNEDGKSENIIINPTTGDTILHYLVLLIIALTGLILSINKKKIKGMKIGNLIIVLAIILTPFAIFAKEKYEVQIKFNDIDIIGEYETYNITIDPKNGDPAVTKQITYGEKIGALPTNPTKDGYTFDKWVDNKGNTVTEDTTITGPISIEAKYNIVKYDITYNLDGGSVSGNPTKYTIEDTITLKNPSKQGYTFAGWTGTGIDTQTTSVTIPVGSTGARSYVAHYSASEDTAYTVIHKFAKLTEGYDIEEVTEHGTTGSTVPAPRKTRTGFVTPSVQNVTISADGSASVTYIYERETYAFSITDRTYIDASSTEDGTYPYGTEITAKAVARPGYDFAWSDGETALSRTFELESAKELAPVYTAKTNTPYKVIHRKQKVTLDGYVEADTQNLTGTTDSEITPAVNTYTGFTSPSTQTVTIDGNGSTVVTYDYDRETYAFSITDRTYIDPTSAVDGNYPYEKEITVKALERAGYGFKWSDDDTNYEKTITITGPVTLAPIYTADENTPYTVKHMKQKINGDYELADTDNLTGTTDTEITPSVKTYEGFTSPSTQTTTISGDGHTLVTYNYTRNKYTLTIENPEYVEEDKSGEYYYEEEVTLKAIDRQGYDFAGWSNGETTKEITVTIGTENITVKPIYTNRTDTTYKIEHEYERLNGDYKIEEEVLTGETGKEVEAPLKPKTGFVSPSVQRVTITADGKAKVTYTYNRERYDFSVTNRTNLENESTANGRYPYETEIYLKAKEKTGYTFAWSDEETSLERTFELTGNTELSLVYIPNIYTVEFDPNTGVGDMASQEMSYDEKEALTKNTFTKVGYIFVGWNTERDGTGTSYEDEEEVENLVPTGTITLYAQWILNPNTPYQVVHQKQKITLDGYDIAETENLTGTTDSTITPEVKTYEGFTSPSTQTTTIAGDGSTVVTYNYDREEYTVTFDTDGESEVADQTIIYGNKITKPADPTKTGYIFDNWYTDDTYSTVFDFDTIITSDTTIYAKYNINTYTVTLNPNGGTVTPTSITVNAESQIGELPTPVAPEGKSFAGWYTDLTGGIEVTNTYIPNADIEIYARYNNSTYTVSFDTDGGTEIPSQTIEEGGKVTKPADSTKTGYTFDNWYTTDSFETIFDFENTTITSDTTIYAHFEELKVCADNENITRLSENTCSNNENITIGDGIVCKRAVKLHEETCSQTDETYYCSGAGYTESGSKGTSTITYGSCGTSGTLTSGDAFTCDVNGDGDFDELTERFYYVSDYYDTSAKKFDTSTAVLIYYNNVTSGVSCNKNTFAYDSSNENWHGPRTLVSQLPTTSQWSNVSLKSDTRAILAEYQSTHDSPTTGGETLPTNFSYEGYAARLLTAKELMSGCNLTEVGRKTTGELDSCDYIMENTRYAKSTIGSAGHWLETPYAFDSNSVWYVGGYYHSVHSSSTNNSNFGSARPVIEVPKTAIDIGTQSKYTVSFNSDGGSDISDIEVNPGDSIDELPTPTKADSVFVGWFESVTDENPVTEPYTPSGNITLIAKWNNIICKKATTLHTETCNQTDGSKYCSGDGYANGDTITYGNIISSDTYQGGDAFDCDVDGTGYNQRFYYLRTKDNKAVLISNKNFTAASKQADQNISFIYSQAHDQLPTTSDWGNLPVKFDGKPARLITMEDLLTVTGASNPDDLASNGSLKGYEFLFESSNFSGIGERSTQWLEEISSTERYRYRNDQYNLAKVEAGKENSSKNPVRPVIEVPLDLIEDVYIVKFNANGGTPDLVHRSVKKGSTLGTLPTATKTGYVLDTWYTNLNFTEPVTASTIPNGYVTYFAKWVKPVEDMIIDSDTYTLEVGEADSITIIDPEEIEPRTYLSNDTSVVTVDSNGNIEGVGEGSTTITITGTRSGTTKTITATVYAQLTDFTVSFDSQGGSTVEDMTVPINTAIGSLPADPTKADYTFGGWFTNTNYSTQVTVDTIIRGNVTFYAKWIPNNAVAEINNTFYTTLQAAVDDAPTTKTTIILLKNVEVTSPIDMSNKNTDKDIILDLNGYTLSTGSSAPNKTNVIKTKAKLEVKNGTISSAKNDALIDVEGSTSYLVLREDITLISTGGRACVYNTGGNALIDGNASLTSNAEWTSSMKRGTVQTLTSGVTTIKGGTIINNRASSSYAVAIELGTVTIGTEDGIYDIQNLIMQGETNGIYALVDYSLYDGMIKGKTAAVNDESKITGIETGATKVNDTDSGYNRLYYTLPVSKYKVTLNANGGEVDPTYINVDAGDQVGTLPTPTRGLYTFDGWWTDYSGGTQVTSSYEPTENVEIIARWHYNSSTNLVSFNMNNNAIETYANYISSWKDLPQATFQANMMDNMNTNSCSKCDQPNSCNNPTSGTLCDQSVGYNTGVSSDLKVYTSDETTKTKGSLVSYTTSSNGIIYNMIPGETYYWEAADDSTVYGIVKVNGYRRLIKSPVRNVRDLGGLAVDTDGDGTSDGRIKYGILFRGAQLSSNQSDATSLQKLGITRELDLRPNSEGKDKGQAVLPKYDIDTPGSEQDVIMHNYLISYSTHPDYYTELRNTIKTVMNYVVEDDDSIFFHCTIGTDRTGTLAYFLEGLLGVSEEDRLEDYELSYYFGMTNRDRYHDNLQNSSINPRFTTMYNTYNTNAKIYEWFMNENPNITQAEKDADEILLSRFRQKMIE